MSSTSVRSKPWRRHTKAGCRRPTAPQTPEPELLLIQNILEILLLLIVLLLLLKDAQKPGGDKSAHLLSCYTDMDMNRHTRAQTHTHTDTRAQKHKCTDTHTSTDTHIHAQTHTHTLGLDFDRKWANLWTLYKA